MDLKKNGTYNTDTVEITQAEIDRNAGSVRNFSMQELLTLRTVNRWLPTESDFTREPTASTGKETNGLYAFQVLYFYGLPANTNFGKLFI